MPVTAQLASPDSLEDIVGTVALWQHTDAPVQLHPGDLGWQWRSGAGVLAESLWVWRRDGLILAVGMIDGPGLIRMALAPSVDQDAAFAAALLADLSHPARGVLPAGAAAVEARFGAAFRDLLQHSGWAPDQPWTPLCRHLDGLVEDCGLRTEIVDAHNVEDRVAVQRAMFPQSAFTLEQWQAMAAAPPYRQGRCLLGYDSQNHPVAAVTVWSAGPGRPGLLEPLGVHRDHRGRGYGRAIGVAAAAALQELGSSTATVCTPSDNVAAVAAYVSAGFRELPQVPDFRR